ncbi:MAG: potassium-transporting ATPase subunit KdpC [Chloroflexi bacterium]|nr:potassium-transporting ATPase subunit KdpC [Chloroflexota bacterium]
MTLILHQIRPALMMTVILTAVLGLAYPLAITGVAQVIFPHQANGSLLYDASGAIIGSELIGQEFTAPGYFHGRPSVTVDADSGDDRPYNAANTTASNLGPTNQKLIDAVEERAKAYRQTNGLPDDAIVPVDAVTASGSGLDPHITPANAQLQIDRVAAARGAAPAEVAALVQQNTEGRTFGFLGEPRINVLKLNLALDAQYGKP